MARIKRALISLELFQEMITQGWIIGCGKDVEQVYCQEGIPEGAEFRGAEWSPKHYAIEMTFEHESFRDLERGQVPEIIHIIMGRKTRPIFTEECLEIDEALTDGD